jgi:hypothetical protein
MQRYRRALDYSAAFQHALLFVPATREGANNMKEAMPGHFAFLKSPRRPIAVTFDDSVVLNGIEAFP